MSYIIIIMQVLLLSTMIDSSINAGRTFSLLNQLSMSKCWSLYLNLLHLCCVFKKTREKVQTRYADIVQYHYHAWFCNISYHTAWDNSQWHGAWHMVVQLSPFRPKINKLLCCPQVGNLKFWVGRSIFFDFFLLYRSWV